MRFGFKLTLAAAVAVSGTLAFAPAAHALTPPTAVLGQKGEIAIDQISGFRLSSTGGVNYYGPIGFSVTSVTDPPIPGLTNANTSVTDHFTTFWFAPSADIFVIDHLSVGGLIEFSTTSSSQDITVNSETQSFARPSTTSFTFVPRVGWMFALSDRFGIWPRLGLGFASRQTVVAAGNNDITDTLSGVVVDLDVGFIFRMTDTFFLRAAPDLSFLPGGSYSTTLNNQSFAANGSAFQFSGTTGIGVFIDL